MDSINIIQSLAEAVSMPTSPRERERALEQSEPPPPEHQQQSPETTSPMAKQGIKLEEKLWVDECYLFQDESLAPVFCKSKLIPLKTITTQKLEQMQKEQMEKVQMTELPPEKAEIIEEGEEPPADAPSSSEPKEADVWTADV